MEHIGKERTYLKAAILGATSLVGERFVQLLDDHPRFEVTTVTGSDRIQGILGRMSRSAEFEVSASCQSTSDGQAEAIFVETEKLASPEDIATLITEFTAEPHRN
jgi:aspartate-semialdehyde dehydrogenase